MRRRLEQLAQVYGAMTSAGVFRAASIKRRRSRQGDRKCPARHQHRLHERGRPDHGRDRRVGAGTCSTRRGPSGISCGSSRGWSAATASGSIPITSATWRSRSAIIRRSSWRGGRPMTAWARGSPTGCTRIAAARPGRSLVLGLTFKENVPDLRNSRSIDLFSRLAELGHDVAVADPDVDGDEAEAQYGRALSDPTARPIRPGDRRGAARCISRSRPPPTLGAMLTPRRDAGRHQGHVARPQACTCAGLLDIVT